MLHDDSQSHITMITNMVLFRRTNQQRQIPLADPGTGEARVIASS